MAPDADPDGPLTAAERRLLELLGVLSTEEEDVRAGFAAADLVRRARRQQDTRVMLLLGSGVLAAVASGLAGLLPPPPEQRTEPS